MSGCKPVLDQVYLKGRQQQLDEANEQAPAVLVPSAALNFLPAVLLKADPAKQCDAL